MRKIKNKQHKNRTYKKHNGLVQLAAELSDRSPSTVYGVLYKRFKSAPVERALKQARARLRRTHRKVA